MKKYMNLLKNIPVGTGFAIPFEIGGYLEIKKIREEHDTIIYKSIFYDSGRRIFSRTIITTNGDENRATSMIYKNEEILIVEDIPKKHFDIFEK